MSKPQEKEYKPDHDDVKNKDDGDQDAWRPTDAETGQPNPEGQPEEMKLPGTGGPKQHVDNAATGQDGDKDNGAMDLEDEPPGVVGYDDSGALAPDTAPDPRT
jgi:hypothetical protein